MKAVPTSASVPVRRVPLTQRASAVWERVGPRARDVAFVCLSLLWSVAHATSGSHDGRTQLLYLCVGIVASATLWWRRQFPMIAIVAGTVAFLLFQMPVALAVGLFTLAVRRRDLVLVVVTIACGVVFAIGSSNGTAASGYSLLVVGLIEAGFCTAAGAYVGARHDLVESLRERARRAEEERELRAEQVRIGERTRIAQEMHDVLAHKVSLIALHAGALEINSTAEPEQIQRSAELIRTTAREAMEDLRDVLGVLRSGEDPSGRDLAPQPTAAEIERVVDASRAAGVHVELVMDVPELPASTARTAYRVVQEGLTNVHKHARGAATTVTITGDPSHGVTVEVSNQHPVSSATLLPGSGAGLVGLRERVGLVGGSLHAGVCDDGGWRLRAWLPWGPA